MNQQTAEKFSFQLPRCNPNDYDRITKEMGKRIGKDTVDFGFEILVESSQRSDGRYLSLSFPADIPIHPEVLLRLHHIFQVTLESVLSDLEIQPIGS
ncbi:MAG: hypothetical protein F4065_00010 [Rhodothermaceae bacterium]|nr:hypothetical protein [Rhodothermaceae bacterium]MXZ58576.1 hypothetical protein [Rhodothermaceae bacterium]MYB89954.1 hypothetical protein [Rhodothermaceae bacterium]MYD67725.1 hypothetical protein [Rhodothermaceae bacterium]MYG43695.1 hypothetical protein [Rhodothermaceae bacterium]